MRSQKRFMAEVSTAYEATLPEKKKTGLNSGFCRLDVARPELSTIRVKEWTALLRQNRCGKISIGDGDPQSNRDIV